MTEPITVYGATDCDDTERVRSRLVALGVPFKEVNIDHDREAESFVTLINNGYRSTPTLLIGEGKLKRVVTEPSDAELDDLLLSAGYRL